MVHDCGFVGYNLAIELISRGFDVELFDFCVGESFFDMAMRLRRVDADLVHGHFVRSSAYACFLSGKPYVLHCHGSDVRGGLNFVKKLALKKAGHVFVSTPDLKAMYPDFEFLPNVVGREFEDFGCPERGGWVYFRKVFDGDRVVGGDVFVPDCWIPHKLMPDMLNRFEGLIDQRAFPAMSVLCLEALACGCKVRLWDGSVVEGFPVEHDRVRVVDRLVEVYEEVLGC